MTTEKGPIGEIIDEENEVIGYGCKPDMFDNNLIFSAKLLFYFDLVHPAGDKKMEEGMQLVRRTVIDRVSEAYGIADRSNCENPDAALAAGRHWVVKFVSKPSEVIPEPRFGKCGG